MAVPFPLHLQPGHWIAPLPAIEAGMLGSAEPGNESLVEETLGLQDGDLDSSPIKTQDSLRDPQQITCPFSLNTLIC